jgi:hypothetical protein
MRQMFESKNANRQQNIWDSRRTEQWGEEEKSRRSFSPERLREKKIGFGRWFADFFSGAAFALVAPITASTGTF